MMQVVENRDFDGNMYQIFFVMIKLVYELFCKQFALFLRLQATLGNFTASVLTKKRALQCSSSINPCKVERKMATSSKRHENCNSQLQFTITVKSDAKISDCYIVIFLIMVNHISPVLFINSLPALLQTGYKASEYLSPNFSLKAVADQLGEAALRE